MSPERGDLETELGDDPIAAFGAWLSEAREAVPLAEAMALATVSRDGEPSVRFVLCRMVDDRGIGFYTNHDSDKGRDLALVPRAAISFHWQPLHRQVRLTGPVERQSDAESAAYFAGRDRASRLSAWASPQSQPVADRAALEQRWRDVEHRFTGVEVGLPSNWGGYRVLWETVEFWQGRRDRLHDRVRFRRAADGWQRERLAP